MKTHTISFYENEISEKHASSFLSASFNMLHSRKYIHISINVADLTILPYHFRWFFRNSLTPKHDYLSTSKIYDTQLINYICWLSTIVNNSKYLIIAILPFSTFCRFLEELLSRFYFNLICKNWSIWIINHIFGNRYFQTMNWNILKDNVNQTLKFFMKWKCF